MHYYYCYKTFRVVRFFNGFFTAVPAAAPLNIHHYTRTIRKCFRCVSPSPLHNSIVIKRTGRGRELLNIPHDLIRVYDVHVCCPPLVRFHVSVDNHRSRNCNTSFPIACPPWEIGPRCSHGTRAFVRFSNTYAAQFQAGELHLGENPCKDARSPYDSRVR